MLRLLLPFTSGIILAAFFPIRAELIYVSAFGSFALLLIWRRYSDKRSVYKNRWVFGMLAGLTLLLTGYSLAIIQHPGYNNRYYSHYLNSGNDTILAEIDTKPVEKEKSIKAVAEIKEVIRDGKEVMTNGKALLYFKKDSLAGTIKYGDVLVLDGNFQPVKPPSNPGEFDYKSYLYRHGITREAYLRSNCWRFTDENSAPWLPAFALHCREKAIALLKEKIKGTEASLASAILLGYRDDLPQPLIQQYADSGVIHVICVAGLHVGILFGLVTWILTPLKRLRGGKFILPVIILLLMWFYALFTGLATPVLRATVMFSFLYIGRFFGPYSNGLNNLAASAFLLLVINPLSIADTGFQLSFLSVAGILILYPPLYRAMEFHNYLADKTWELICLSIAAQAAIAPLSIIYFHQFPNYFVIANLLIIPLLAAAIFCGVMFFASSFFPVILSATSLILQKILMIMNLLVTGMHRLPYFAERGIAISDTEAIMLYIMLIAGIIFIRYKKQPYLFILLSVILIFICGRVWIEYNRRNQQVFTIYNIPGRSAAAFLSGHGGVLVQPVDSLDFCEHIQPDWRERGIVDSCTCGNAGGMFLANRLCFQTHYAQFNSLEVAFIRSKDDIPYTGSKLKMNYIVVSGGNKLNMADIQNAFIFDRIIFDSSVSDYRRKKWEDECDMLHISYYDVTARGAFIQKVES